MATIIRDGLKLCADCLIIAVNGDASGLDYHYGTGLDRFGVKVKPSAFEREEQITAGLTRLGPGLVPDFDDETGKGIEEFSTSPCGCCETKLYGSRHEFVVLG